MDDQDEDGMLTWQEYVADTDPTNEESVLCITGIGATNSGSRVHWKGGRDARQFLERREDLVATAEQWIAIFTNSATTPAATNVLDADAGGRTLFYRIKAERE